MIRPVIGWWLLAIGIVSHAAVFFLYCLYRSTTRPLLDSAWRFLVMVIVSTILPVAATLVNVKAAKQKINVVGKHMHYVVLLGVLLAAHRICIFTATTQNDFSDGVLFGTKHPLMIALLNACLKGGFGSQLEIGGFLLGLGCSVWLALEKTNVASGDLFGLGASLACAIYIWITGRMRTALPVSHTFFLFAVVGFVFSMGLSLAFEGFDIMDSVMWGTKENALISSAVAVLVLVGTGASILAMKYIPPLYVSAGCSIELSAGLIIHALVTGALRPTIVINIILCGLANLMMVLGVELKHEAVRSVPLGKVDESMVTGPKITYGGTLLITA
eukprot:NODE_2385_length_1214_cov_17.921030_g2176_i0.p1 GENE.NODE_2385_length_1214_cov_17.921030_g2176_i0~~NODE_2385_length_1214_cov_17.921030_g2176_i0.p1  ORF type:complete len:376 (-),score=63.72 NODE_2385_length_1214_cov_17.921030_g2176_i0:87-1076(-)